MSIEQKKKAQVKRAKAEKETGPAVKPDEVDGFGPLPYIISHRSAR